MCLGKGSSGKAIMTGREESKGKKQKSRFRKVYGLPLDWKKCHLGADWLTIPC